MELIMKIIGVIAALCLSVIIVKAIEYKFNKPNKSDNPGKPDKPDKPNKRNKP